MVHAPFCTRRHSGGGGSCSVIYSLPDALGGLFASFKRLLRLVAEVALAEFNHDCLENAREPERHLVRVVLDDGRGGVFAHVEGLIEGKTAANGSVDFCLRHLLVVHEQRDGATLANAATVLR